MNPSPLNSQFNHSAKAVRDPAGASAEGVRFLPADNGQAYPEYQVAQLSDGAWAIRTGCEYVGFAGRHSRWKTFPTRKGCIAEFLLDARRFFSSKPNRGASDGHKAAWKQMQALLSDGLFGFIEPAVDAERTRWHANEAIHAALAELL